MNALVVPAANYAEVGFIGGDLQFMLWFIAGIIFVFACARDSALHEKLFPHRPSIYRTWRMATLLITILLIAAVPAGNNSRAGHLARNIDTKYENAKVDPDDLRPLMEIYGKAKGDLLVVEGYGGNYHLVANGKNEPTLQMIPSGTAPELKLREHSE